MILPATAQAFEAKLSGQVSRMMVAPNDAVGSEIQQQDIGWSGSRFRFTGSEKGDHGIEYGFRFEIQARNNRPNATGDTLKNTGDNQDNRYQDLYFSGDFGKVSFGKGDGASNGSTEVDMSGTALSSSSNHQDNWGAYAITKTGGGTGGTDPISWSSVFTMADGLSRQNRIRYDTPSFSGFSAAFSFDQGNATEIAGRYKADIGDHKFGAAIFFDSGVEPDTHTNGDKISGGSASLLLSNGLNFTAAYSQVDFEKFTHNQDATTVKVGYKTGMHAFSVDYGEGENKLGQQGDTTGATYAIFPHPGVELFATYRQLDSTKVANSESVDIVAIGSRIKF